MSLKLKKWDVAEHMDNGEYITEYLKVALESGDTSEIVRAPGGVARARNMTDLAAKIGISRQGLYKTLSENSNPEFATIQKLITALGLQMSIIAPAKPVSKLRLSKAGAQRARTSSRPLPSQTLPCYNADYRKGQGYAGGPGRKRKNA